MLTLIKDGFRTALYRCECGNIKWISSYNVREGRTKSCGCLNAKLAAQRLTTHGMVGTPEYSSWQNMKIRVFNPNHRGNYWYKNTFIDFRWIASFEAFLADMGKCPPHANTVDRIDGNLGYFKDNCQWLSRSENSAKQ